MRRRFGSVILLFCFGAAGCISATATPPAVVVMETSSGPSLVDEEFSALLAQLHHDLALAREHQGRSAERGRADRRLAGPSRDEVLLSLQMPVVGVRPHDLDDNFGHPRDGGRRSHRGIDIFAPHGSKIVAVADGMISYIGEQPKGGRCLWLMSNSGLSFYYAHLDRWVAGLYEGMRVHKGDLIGYVGNTGNAKNTPPHLHFQVADRGGVLNPYPILQGSIAGRAAPILQGGFGK